MKKNEIIDREHFETLRSAYRAYEDARRELIKTSGDALALSKQAIFALHRGEEKEAEKILEQVRAVQARLAPEFERLPSLASEGSYRAMLEEFVEASLYAAYVRGEAIGPIEAAGMDEDIYFGGLIDFTGELVRRAILAATKRDDAEVHRCSETAHAVFGELVPMNIVGPLRPKYDQAKTNVRKLEEVLYDLSLRNRSGNPFIGEQ